MRKAEGFLFPVLDRLAYQLDDAESRLTHDRACEGTKLA